ncbi:MAG: hypothetical protein MUE96_05660 [Bacteroidia bacterium]|jgi:hypothetical protein|nr:hypothetical protein [Bacteroidia bacterium]
MIKKYLLLTTFLWIGAFGINAQTKIYPSSSGEMIFSFARIVKSGNEVSSNLRWSPVFNLQGLVNYDVGQSFGFFHGLAVRNVGFIYDVPGTDTLKKFRTYNVGIPLGIKLGNVKDNGFFVYGGYEFEIPFNYKEKTFVSERKVDKFSLWFSNRTEWYTQSVFVGFNFPKGFNIKFKYYLNQFFNQQFKETSNGVQSMPFQNFDANVFYIALDWNVFKDVRSYSVKSKQKIEKQTQNRYTLGLYQ